VGWKNAGTVYNQAVFAFNKFKSFTGPAASPESFSLGALSFNLAPFSLTDFLIFVRKEIAI